MFARLGAGALSFHPTPDLTTLDVAEVLAAVEPLISRRLHRSGLAEGDEDVASDGWAKEAPVLAGLAAASVREPWRWGLAGARGSVVWATSQSPLAPGHCHARANAFDLHASFVVAAGQPSGSSACAGMRCVHP